MVLVFLFGVSQHLVEGRGVFTVLGYIEISYKDLFVLGYQYVGGLNVSVTHFLAVKVLDSSQNLSKDLLRISLCVLSHFCNFIQQLRPLDELHDLTHFIFEVVAENLDASHHIWVFQSSKNFELLFMCFQLFLVVISGDFHSEPLHPRVLLFEIELSFDDIEWLLVVLIQVTFV